MLPWLVAGAIAGGTNLVSGMWSARKENKRRKREAQETISDLERQREGELRQMDEDISMAYGTAESSLAGGGIRSTYLPEMREQRRSRSRENINTGYSGMIGSVARAGGLPWFNQGKIRK